MDEVFVIARQPASRSRLPYLLRLPGGGPGNRPIFLATQGKWPGPKDLFCYELGTWPEGAEVLAEVPVQSYYRRGREVHLVLKRRVSRRSVFVWTQSRGRPLIFWRTPRSMRGGRPASVYRRRAGLMVPLPSPWISGNDTRGGLPTRKK